MGLPALRLEIVGMHVIAFAYRGNHAANILAVLDHRVAYVQVLEGDFVAERYLLIGAAPEFAVVLGHHAKEIRSRGHAFDHDHCDVIAMIMHEQMRSFSHGRPPGRSGTALRIPKPGKTRSPPLAPPP